MRERFKWPINYDAAYQSIHCSTYSLDNEIKKKKCGITDMGLVSDDIHHRKTTLLICNANLCVLYNKRKSCRAFPIAPDKISKCKQLSCCEVIDTFADSC